MSFNMFPNNISINKRVCDMLNGALILNGFPISGSPSILTPALKPLGKDIYYILTVGLEFQRQIRRKCKKCFIYGPQLHQIVRCTWMGAARPTAIWGCPGPTTRTGISEARSVGGNCQPNGLHGIQSRRVRPAQ